MQWIIFMRQTWKKPERAHKDFRGTITVEKGFIGTHIIAAVRKAVIVKPASISNQTSQTSLAVVKKKNCNRNCETMLWFNSAAINHTWVKKKGGKKQKKKKHKIFTKKKNFLSFKGILYSLPSAAIQLKNHVKLLFISANLSVGSETDTYLILVTVTLMILRGILSGKVLVYFQLLNIW